MRAVRGPIPGARIPSEQEISALAKALLAPVDAFTAGIAAMVRDGEDPLGDMLIACRSPEARRGTGTTYTPAPIVEAMLDRVGRELSPVRLVDAGAGSGRFTLTAARRFPDAALVAVEPDDLAADILEAGAEVVGVWDRLDVRRESFLETRLDPVEGPTLFIGNPPYIRHHSISAADKAWLRGAVGSAGAGLAGLHIYFFVRTLQLARPGDAGLFIVPSEWLDVGYGRALRDLLVGPLGGREISVFPPESAMFAGVATTATTVLFRPHDPAVSVRFRRARYAGDVSAETHSSDRMVPSEVLRATPRWSGFGAAPQTGTSAAPALITLHARPLGDFFRVSRGQVTGANRIWISPAGAPKLPDALTVPVVTRAAELFASGGALRDAGKLKRAVNLPRNLSTLPDAQRRKAREFIKWAEQQGARDGYIASARSAWWSVGYADPAPIICTYMARRAPAFIRNLCGARIVNIAHGLYPRVDLADEELDALAAWLSRAVTLAQGRTYAGGLVKFEPREVEAILVPNPSDLVEPEDRLVVG